MIRKLAAASRVALGGLIMFVVTGLVAAVATIVAAYAPESRRLDRLAHVWARCFLAVANTRLEILGGDDIDRSRSYVVVANHLSELDIAVSFLAAPVGIRFLAKKELFRIPLLGLTLRTLGMVRVDRQAGPTGHDNINRQVCQTLSNGQSLMVFPEGTRSRQGVLGPFKRGAFWIAIDNQIDILPMTIIGTYEAWPPASPWVYGGAVSVLVHDPIPMEGLTHDDIDTVLHAAREVISAGLPTTPAPERSDGRP